MAEKRKSKTEKVRPVRLADVARVAQVSASTASVVLNPDRNAEGVRLVLAERVRRVAEEMGYVPNFHARTMRLSKTFNIAVALEVGNAPKKPHNPHVRLANHYFSELIGAIECEADRVGYITSIFSAREHASALARSLDALLQKRIDGVILPTVVSPEKLEPLISKCEEEAVVLLEYAGKTRCSVVNWDEQRALELALDHLGELGHRHILWMGPMPETTREVMHPREQRFLQAALARGLHPLTLQVVHQEQGSGNDILPRKDEQIVKSSESTLAEYMNNAPKAFTAIIGYNDFFAIGACHALSRRGVRIPSDISVVGIDNIAAGLVYPSLTTVDHMLVGMGRASVQALIERVDAKLSGSLSPGKVQAIMPELVVRESTGPAPQ